jgi:hypothetical protein
MITVYSILKIGMETTGFASLGERKLGSSVKFMMKSLREPMQDITHAGYHRTYNKLAPTYSILA